MKELIGERSTVKAIIIDDESKAIQLLKVLIQECSPQVEVIGTANSVLQAKKMLSDLSPDIIFLDIEMPGGDGFSFLDSIETKNFHVIFTTAYNEYAIKAIKYAALDFILKPIRVKDLKRAIELSADKLYHDQQFQVLSQYFEQTKDKERIILPGHHFQKVVQLSEICRIKAQNNYVIFHLIDGSEFLVSHNLQYYCDILPESKFFRIHRSCLVNLNQVKSYDRGTGGQVYLKDGSTESIATRRKPDFIKSLRNI